MSRLEHVGLVETFEGRERHGREQSDNGHHHQQLDQRESARGTRKIRCVGPAAPQRGSNAGRCWVDEAHEINPS